MQDDQGDDNVMLWALGVQEKLQNKITNEHFNLVISPAWVVVKEWTDPAK